MESTGIVRRLDDLGRVVLPKEIRRTLRLKEGDPLELFLDGFNLVLKRYSPLSKLENYASCAVKALENRGITAVVYDRDKAVAGSWSSICSASPDTQSEILNINSFSMDVQLVYGMQGKKLWCYPLNVDGENIGFLVGPDFDTGEKHSAEIKVVADMLRNFIAT